MTIIKAVDDLPFTCLHSTPFISTTMSQSTQASKRIVFTGGSGIAGPHVVQKLLSYNHEILNVDMTPLDNPDVYTLKADLTDGAQAFNSLSCHFRKAEPFPGPVKMPDAVVHFAGKVTSWCLLKRDLG